MIQVSSVIIEMSANLHDKMVDHAKVELPYEACGLFGGPAGSPLITRFYPMRNVAESREIYVIDSHEMMAVERDADTNDLTIKGVMHSHPHTIGYPSSTDIDDAARFDPFGVWYFIIVSLLPVKPSLRVFHIVDGEVTEGTIHITDLEG